MKKLLLSTLFASLSIFAFAQANVSITLDSPVAGANLASGTAFNFDVTITNTGSEPIDAMDTIIIIPTVNGSGIANQSGGILAFGIQRTIAANGGSDTYSQSLTLTGGADGALNFCSVIGVLGAGWSGVTESDTTDNQNCSTVNWSTGTIGISEIRLASLEDNSFYNNGVYNVRLSAANASQSMTFELINLTGKVIQSSTFDVNNSEVSEDISLNAPAKGVYIARLTSNGQPVSTKKIIVQ